MPSSTSNEAPRAFCWTKMGAESGEGLRAILQRKEWERSLGGGVFYWGIGNSVATALEVLARRQAKPEVLFSPIRSKAKAIDEQPAAVQLWLTYHEEGVGEVPLPGDVFVTSRLSDFGHQMAPHYALVCWSDAPLTESARGLVDFRSLRNLVSGKRLGFSQVTSVVERVEGEEEGAPLTYPVALRAQLEWPYVVRFATGATLSPDQLKQMAKIQNHGSIVQWRNWVRRTKLNAWADIARSRSREDTQLFLDLKKS